MLKAVMEIRVILARILRIADRGSLGQGQNIYNIIKNLR